MQVASIQSALEIYGRKYEGASKASRLSGWRATGTSANQEIFGAGSTLRDRARDLRRNNPHAARGIQVIATNVVGDGIRPQLNHDNRKSIALKQAIERWAEWAESSNCDRNGRMNIYQMQSLVMEAVPESGEIFLIRHRLSKTQGGRVPLHIEILEADFLDTSKNEKLSNDSIISQGIEYDAAGRAVAYHFFKIHPGDQSILNLYGRETVRITADRVRHIFRGDRPHQGRGVTWLAPVMVRLHELDIFQDATLKKQQIAACFSAFIEDTTGAMKSAATAYELLEKLDSGTVSVLPQGAKPYFANPPGAADYPEFMKQELRAIAVGLGITYESLTNDYGNVNFSSGRMGWIEMGRNIRRWQREIIIDQMMNPIWTWFAEAVDFVTPANVDMSQVWTRWTKPPREMIDPSKEVSAANDAIRSGQTTLSEVLRSRGFDPDEVFEERAREQKTLKELGIKTDSDPNSEEPKQLAAPANAKPKSDDGVKDENEEDSDADPAA